MSMNKYMHPRNIYIKPPNFKELAILYPEFRKYLQQDIAGKVTLDFKDVNAIRALSRVLLLKDFDLNVEIPLNKLIPTIPLRLNYLLWIEDLLNIERINLDKVYGIDIGTGASCVYPLMAAKKFNWNMVGTEIDKDSLECAKKNISNNFLNEKVMVYESTKNTLLKEVVQNMNLEFHFCMCNPPFFSSTQELHPFFKSRKSTRPHPKNAFCASIGEVVVNGGEIQFISNLINESAELKNKVKIFTTMIGHKSSLVPLKALLRKLEVCSFKQTEFCQGHTTRWGLAWTFLDIDLRSIPAISKVRKKPPLNFVVPNSDKYMYTVDEVNAQILKIIEDLKLQVKEQKKNKGNIIYEITASSNTWSKQRRRKREQLKQLREEEKVSEKNCDLISMSPHGNHNELFDTSEKLAEIDLSSASNTPKRENEDEDEYYDKKRFKTTNNLENNYIAEFCLVIRKRNLK
ncbi:hypothetical protein WA026_014290 [Henosepilachna vigintioctopunctata]|uniref:U6 small nuclear RNA (adenine-(43)-N(6))-methyltransferase n=1 Tax=Henosepilachna vigintioctopunctata TaxID=420089 RepID=A0AAW1TTU3_9CUCU